MKPSIRVLKYKLVTGWNTLETRGPVNRNNSVIDDQSGDITLWVANDTNQPVQTHRLYVTITGEEVPQAAEKHQEMWYLGTCVQRGGGFVTHTFIQL